LYNKAKTYDETQKSFEGMKRENEISLSEVDSALKRCLEITTEAKKKASEITSTGLEAKSWLEKENEMLREGLTNVLEKVKQLDSESQTLRETLEVSQDYFKKGLENLNIRDVLELCEGYIARLKDEEENKNKVIGDSARDRNEDSEDCIENIVERKEKDTFDGESKSRKRKTMDNHSKTELQGNNSKGNDNRQKNAEKKFQKIWKEVALSRGKGNKNI